jgi:hypothetical protein
MPLTPFQAELALLLSVNRTPDSYLAGGSALHIQPNSVRYSKDLDYFHDSVERVATAFQQDQQLLLEHGYGVDVDMQQPGYLRALVSRQQQRSKVEWAHDSAWRFLPTIQNPQCGYQLHPLDLAINKLLALVGRDEARDLLDVMHVHQTLLPLGAQCWAAAGKDPGYTPLSLLTLLQRRGRVQTQDLQRLHLTHAVDLVELKTAWLEALEQAKDFIQRMPPDQIGCLYFSTTEQSFVQPEPTQLAAVVAHYGRPGGVLPRVLEEE